MPPTSLTRSVLLALRPHSNQRRTRTGPDNSGHRNVIRYLAHQGIDTGTAENRLNWENLETNWLLHNGVPTGFSSREAFMDSRSLWEMSLIHEVEVILSWTELVGGENIRIRGILWPTCSEAYKPVNGYIAAHSMFAYCFFNAIPTGIMLINY